MDLDVAVIIPSRIGSTRLLRKALVKIGNKCLIEHVVHSLGLGFKGNIYVATDSDEIARTAEKFGVITIMTDKNCLSGSDRVLQAFQKIPNRDNIKYVVNVQGDMPFVDPKMINQLVSRLKSGDCEIATPVVKVNRDFAESESAVKVVVDAKWNALYFSRSLIPHGGLEFLYHVGIYGFQVAALEKFVRLQQTNYETYEKLEQLRALENQMKIGVCLADGVPLSVDTEEDLQKAINYYQTINF
jgi:3-deoxy-manno-octulosonate cytidylyltransferase (CMP-KDO synthetase)